MKTVIKASLAIFFFATATLAARADSHSDDDHKSGFGSSSSLPAPDFGWVTLGAVALGYGVFRLRRRSAGKR